MGPTKDRVDERTDSSPIALPPIRPVAIANSSLCMSSRYADSDVHDHANSGGADDPVEDMFISRREQHESGKHCHSWICMPELILVQYSNK